MSITGVGEIKEATIEAVIIRADGTREELGVIARMEPSRETLRARVKARLKKGGRNER